MEQERSFQSLLSIMSDTTPFFIYKQSIFDPSSENCLSFSKKLP